MQIPILMGSATPSIASLYNAKTKGWHFFELHKRFAGTFPEIKTVLLTNKERRTNFWITKELEKAIADRLSKKEQTIIFLNRRGYSFFVQCKDCSFIFECTACSVSLTLHNNTIQSNIPSSPFGAMEAKGRMETSLLTPKGVPSRRTDLDILSCHYCGRSESLPNACPTCKGKDSLLKKGIGTQQVVMILEKLFPHARIGRADMDISSKKKLWQQTMNDFEQGAIDILVGTQTITKGFHFPNVTLVGILWADLNLHFPVYNAGETSLQQLIQVAGRAGRTRPNSTVIVQTMVQHPIFNFLSETDYLKYYEYELNNRVTVGYPPFVRLVEIELKNTNEERIEYESMQLAQSLAQSIAKNKCAIRILGPAKPPVAKIKNTHSRKIYLKSNSISQLIQLFKSIELQKFSSHIFFTPNPN
jgi:primosomal protein N' (replication factor Y)